MTRKSKVLGPNGQPVDVGVLKEEIAAAQVGTVRSPISAYPADGLDPISLANILRQADHGDPVAYLELAEAIEERDPHYLAVLGTRKRSVSQLEITVEPGGESVEEKRHADMLKDWLKRDELTAELFEILDAVGKGYSFTEMIWEAEGGLTYPSRLEWRDPRWFRFKREDLKTPVMLSSGGQEEPLPAFKFIFAPMKAKSGLYLRSGLARVATWTWLFKAYTQRDWAIFTQTYGQPIRVGKYGPGTSEGEKDTLFNAVADIAGDCAAIIPASMQIEFISADNVGSSTDHYKERCIWLDQQTSKAVLGQTATTDAETGGMGSGKEHREVQEDIERADGRLLSAILNQSLVRPFVDLNFGPQKTYPKLVIARPEAEDLKAWTDAAVPWVNAGLRVSEDEVLNKLGLSPPKRGEATVGGMDQTQPNSPDASHDGGETPPETKIKGGLKGQKPDPAPVAALQAETTPQPPSESFSPVSALTDQLAASGAEEMHKLLSGVEAMVNASASLEELRENLLSAFPKLDATELSGVMAAGILAASAGGRAMVEEEADG